MMTKEGSTKIVNFMILGAGDLVLGRGLKSHKVKIHQSYKNHLLYSQAWIRKFMSNDDQGRVYQNCTFHDPHCWGSDVRRGHISHYSEDALSSTLSINNTLIAIVLRDYDAAYLFDRWFSFILRFQIWAFLTRSWCKVSDSQVTVKACGPLDKKICNGVIYTT